MLASRLAEADPSLSILVIEQGMNNYNLPQVIYPALFPQNLLQDSKTALFWQGNQSPHLSNRGPIVPSGGVLGGGVSNMHLELPRKTYKTIAHDVLEQYQLDGLYPSTA